MTSRFPGVLTPLVTPFTDDGELHLDALPALVEHQLASGINGFVVAGTTGEGYALDLAERATMLRTVRELTAGRVPVLVGVGGMGTRESVAQAVAAAEGGADGLMVGGPAYVLPDQAELARHTRRVVDAAALPTVLYDYPARSGVQFGPEALDGLADHPLVVGIKEASGDLDRIGMMQQRYGDAIALISGADALAMHFFAAGSDSWIAGFANALPAEHVAMLAAATAGDLDEGWALSRRLDAILGFVESGHYTAKCRAAVAMRGMPVGPPRAPLAPLGDDETATLRGLMAELLPELQG
jgi:4-hydroxy-tetrahydrodipicolinate synthase